MLATSQSTRHSAQVLMELRVDAGTFRIGQLGPGFVILRPPVEIPPGIGEVVVRIDGSETRFPIRLEHGATSNQSRTPVTALIEAAIPTAATFAA